ncbi:MAG: hypothetical protein BWY46_00686 [Firmicutes bacterium ADurb.Bin300]|jgi:hypothetical protein|nr:MAG: hypothetical protein BWY46_00686 [Firmicutes bacterium ADurb.Bin300]HOD01705.1 hypothetical protein [Clostridiales bacterium]
MISKKKLIVAICIILLIGVGVGCYAVWRQTDAGIQVTVSPPLTPQGNSLVIGKGGSYIYKIGFAGWSPPNFLNEKKIERMEQVHDDLEKHESDFLKAYRKPYMVEAKYENLGGKTVITFKGEATRKDTGVLEEYNKKLVYDFILTKKIHTHEEDTLTYLK